MENDFLNQVKEEVTEYGKTLGKIGQLRLLALVSRVLGLFLLILTLVLCALALYTFGAVAAIDAMATCMPVWAAALIIGSTYIIVIAVALVFRKQLFIHPFIKLLSKQIATEEELALKTIEAEHEAQLQRVRMECQVENATREWNFYVSILSRAWGVIRRVLKK